MFPLNIVCKSLTRLALSRQSISLHSCAKKNFSRAYEVASHHSCRSETSIKCGFLAYLYLVDGVMRARADHASSAVSEAE